MIKTIFRKALANPTLMSWSNNFTTFAHGLIVTPLIVIIFNKDQISVWYLLQTFAGLGLLADAGFRYTLSRAVSFFYAGALVLPKNLEEYNQKLEYQEIINYEKLNNLLSTSFRVYLVISLVFIFIFIPVGIAVMWNVMAITGHDIYLWAGFGIMVTSINVSLQTIKWSAFMTGTNRVGELYRIRTVLGLVKIIGFTLILIIKPGIFNLSLFILAESLFANFYIRGKVLEWFKIHNIKRKKTYFFDKEIFNSLWPASWRLGISTMGQYLTVYGTSLIVGQVKDTALIASYLFTHKILGFGKGIAEAPFYANVPVIYGYMARKDTAEVKMEVSKQLFLTITMLLTGFVFVGLFGNMILTTLNFDIRFISGLMFLLLAISMFFDSHAAIQGTVYIATNHIPFMIQGLISGSAMILFGFWILPAHGLLGVLLVHFTVTLVIGSWFSTYLNLRLLNWPFGDYIYDIFVKGYNYWVNKLKMLFGKIKRI